MFVKEMTRKSMVGRPRYRVPLPDLGCRLGGRASEFQGRTLLDVGTERFDGRIHPMADDPLFRYVMSAYPKQVNLRGGSTVVTLRAFCSAGS
jgi:hypothetical protein